MAPALHRQMASALLVLSAASCVEGFTAPQSRISSTWKEQHQVSPSPWYNTNMAALRATKDDDVTSFSKRKESPLGVRRRVKAVLEKAKTRTGISNSSDRNPALRTEQTALDVVADAASIGGLGGVIVDDMGTVDVALEFRKRKAQQSNGTRDPASTMSPVIKNRRNPEEELVLAAPNTGAATTTTPKKVNGNAEVDAIRADTPAAYAEPLPFTLPRLSNSQKDRLLAGERLQEQSKMGREGSGYVVVDVKAPPYVVWECLLDFESYPNTIPTVRGVQFFSSENLKSGYHDEKPIDPSTGRELRHYGQPSTTRAKFILSKFRLNIAAIHNYRPHPDGHYMVFSLDPECTNVVLQNAKGIWYAETNPDGRGEEYTRVWLICELKVSPILPKFIVDYAARRAMPRASTWLKPQVEAASKLWLKNTPVNGKNANRQQPNGAKK